VPSKLDRIKASRKLFKKSKKDLDKGEPSAESIRGLMRTTVGDKVPHKILLDKDLKARKKALKKLRDK